MKKGTLAPFTFLPFHLRTKCLAFTLAEAVVSCVIVAVMLVAALNTVGGAQVARSKTNDQIRAQFLAQELMAEILSKPYNDPDGPGLLGLDLGEILGLNRLNFDDVDDYDGYVDSPPQTADGTAIAGFSGWKRAVTVKWVDPANLTQTVGTDQGIKRITIDVSRGNLVEARLQALRTSAWQFTNSH